jgi:CRISPR/Cas system-associated exonuclease Cas4 (RecB family)
MANGNMHHDDIALRLGKMKRARNPEGFLEIPEIGATGYYDNLSTIDYENQFETCAILEVKTKYAGVSQVIQQGDYDQGQLYFHGARFSKRLEVKRIKVIGIRLLYVDRTLQTDDGYFAWKISIDYKRITVIMEFMKWLKVAIVDNGYCPPHPYAQSNAKCQYCRYFYWCWRDFPTASLKASQLPDALTSTVPEKEILDFQGKRYLELLSQESKIRKEKEMIKNLFLNYFKIKEVDEYPVSQLKAIAPTIKKTTNYIESFLKKELGEKMYNSICSPDKKKMEEAIERGFMTGTIFEASKEKIPQTPGIKVVNRKDFIDQFDHIFNEKKEIE